MVRQLVDVLAHGDDLGVQIALERGERLRRVLGVPDRRRSHPEYLRPLLRRPLEVLAHDAVVCVVLTGVVALVEHH